MNAKIDVHSRDRASAPPSTSEGLTTGPVGIWVVAICVALVGLGAGSTGVREWTRIVAGGAAPAGPSALAPAPSFEPAPQVGSSATGPTATIEAIAAGPEQVVAATTQDAIEVRGIGETPQILARGDAVDVQALSPDGRTLAAGQDDGAIKLWDVTSGRVRRTLYQHAFAVRSLAFSPDGERLASGGWDAKVKIWDLAGLRAPLTLDLGGPVGRVVFSPDGNRLAAAAGGTVWVLELGTAPTTLVTVNRGALVRDLAFSPDGAALTSTTSEDRRVDWKLEPRPTA